MTTTLGVRQNTDRDYRICTGHSKGVDPSWALIKDHNDIRKRWLRVKWRSAVMRKERAFALRGVRKAITAIRKVQAMKRKANSVLGKIFDSKPHAKGI